MVVGSLGLADGLCGLSGGSLVLLNISLVLSRGPREVLVGGGEAGAMGHVGEEGGDMMCTGRQVGWQQCGATSPAKAFQSLL